MQTVTKVNSNMWRRAQGGLYAPVRRRFPINGLVFYAPLWHPELNADPFLTKDLIGHSCDVAGATWGTQGRTFDGNDYIDIDDAFLASYTTGSIGCWFTPSNTTGAHILINISRGADAVVTELQLGINQDAGTPARGLYAHYYIDDVPQWRIDVEKAVYDPSSDFTSHSMMITQNGTAPVLYLDATPVGTFLTETNKTLWLKALYDDADPPDTLTIGARYTNSAYSQYLIGSEGEAYIYNGALSASEVTHWHNSTEWRY